MRRENNVGSGAPGNFRGKRIATRQTENNLDSANREEILKAQATFSFVVALASRNVDAVTTLESERASILPVGDEGQCDKDCEELISLSMLKSEFIGENSADSVIPAI